MAKLYVVGIGPGGLDELTPRALRAIEASEVVSGYGPYLQQIDNLLDGKSIVQTPMKGEVERCRAAVEHALHGRTVCMISGGDPGVYGMAGLVLELAEPHPKLKVEVIPGVTAATAAAAAVGAPLGHDFAVISLSDLLTEQKLIERRLRAAAQADFAICLYNPGSSRRTDALRRACAVLLENRKKSTPCAIARNVGRAGEQLQICTLGELADIPVDMHCTVLVGNAATKVINGRLVTPRGYRL